MVRNFLFKQKEAILIDGHWGPPRGSRGRGRGQNRCSKNLIFKRFAAESISKASRSFSKGEKGSVNLTFNAFFHRNFYLGPLWFPGRGGGHEEVMQIRRFSWFYLEIILTPPPTPVPKYASTNKRMSNESSGILPQEMRVLCIVRPIGLHGMDRASHAFRIRLGCS